MFSGGDFTELCVNKNEKIAVKGHDNPDFDSVVSGILCCSYLRKLGYEQCRLCIPSITDKPTLAALDHAGVDVSEYISPICEDEVLFLVDHHETELKNRVIGCIDHHKTEKKYEQLYPESTKDGKRVFYHNTRSSSTAITVLRMMISDGIEPDRNEYYLALYSIFMDTMSMKSSKFEADDAVWADSVSKRFGFDTSVMRTDGYALTDLSQPVKVIAESNLKYYRFGGRRIASSDIHVTEYAQGTVDCVTEYIRKRISDEKLAMWILIIMDPEHLKTDVIKISASGIFASGISASGGVKKTHYDRLLSRSVDVIPEVEREFG